MWACAEQIFPDLHYLRRQNFSFDFYRNENQFFCMIYPNIPMNGNHSATDVKLSMFYP